MEPLLAAVHDLLAQAPPPKQLLVVAGAIGAAAAAIQAMWNLFFSPLARQKIPGPPLAAISEVWWSWHGVRFQRIHALHAAFETYGSVVRIGPNRVAFRDEAAIRDIYRTHAFRKGAWYKLFTFGGTPNTFNTDDPALHARLRRWSGPAFRGENMRAAALALTDEMDALVSRIQRDCGEDPTPETTKGAPRGFVDVVKLFRRLAMDILGIAVLGSNFNQIHSGIDHPYAKHADEWLIDKMIGTFLPRALYQLLRSLPIAKLQSIFSADASMCQYSAEVYESASIDDKDGMQHSYQQANILSTIKRYREPITGEPAPKNLVVGEAAVFLGAGTDTSNLTVTFFAYQLSLTENASIRANIRLELATVPDELKYDLDVLRGLPYLNATIREILRVNGPGNSFFERITPKAGALLAGYFVPAGTLVGAQAWSAHRDPDVFPDPLTINPDRWVTHAVEGGWVDRPESEIRAMNASFYPFGQGARACVGRPLAEIEILLCCSTIARNFDVKHHSTTRSDMVQMDLGVIKPRGQRCFLRFEYDPVVPSLRSQ